MDITTPPPTPLNSTEVIPLILAPVAVVSTVIAPPAIVPPFIPPKTLASTLIIPPTPPPLVRPLTPVLAVPTGAAPNFPPSSPLDNNLFSSSMSVSPPIGVPPIAPTSVMIPRPPFVPSVPMSIAPPSLVLSAHPPDSTDEQGPVSDNKDSSPSSSPEHPYHSSATDYEITDEIRKAKEMQEQLVHELLMRRQAYAMVVPTNDSTVYAYLQCLNEPVTLFGEREMEIRDRLKTLMTKLDLEGHLKKLMKVQEEEEATTNFVAEDAQDT